MKYVKLSKSDLSDKKFKVMIDGKVIHFGDKRYQDFTQHKDMNRKRLYLIRHQKREHWNNPFTAGFWSRWLLWNKSSLILSKEDITKKFDIKFV